MPNSKELQNYSPINLASPAVKPPTIYEDDFTAMPSTKATNSLNRLGRKHKPKLDAITQQSSIALDDTFKVFLENYSGVNKPMTVAHMKLLDIITQKFHTQNHFRNKNTSNINRVISFSIEEYLTLTGKKVTTNTKKEARKKLIDLLDTFYNMSLEWKESNGENYAKMRICEAQGINRGVVSFSFTQTMAEYLNGRNAYIVHYPKAILRLTEKKPTLFHISRKLMSHQSIDNNIKRDTANIISVQSLLKVCIDIPSYDEVMSSESKQVNQRIIEPFEKALDELASENIITWDYCNAKHAPLTDEQLNNFNYDIFKTLYIGFTVKGMPDQTDRIKAKEKNLKSKRKQKTS